jgi:hypothetical protein
MPGVAQITIRDLGQGVVQLAVRVGEFFAPLIIRMLLIFYPQLFNFVANFTPRGGAVK